MENAASTPDSSLLVQLGFDGTSLLVALDNPAVYYESLVLDIYECDRIRPGETVLDVGANVGDFTIRASRKVGQQGLVIAIEPSEMWYRLLVENVRRNRLSNVVPLKIAVSATGGPISFFDNPPRKSESPQKEPLKYSADSVRISDLLRNHGIAQVDFLKMDIEGWEIEAIRGVGHYIDGLRGLAIETHSPELRETMRELLEGKGFEVRFLQRREVVRNLLRSVIRHPREIVRSEITTRFYGFRRGCRAFMLRGGLAIASPRASELSILYASKRRS
jgi:FkbM family methyltransferase